MKPGYKQIEAYLWQTKQSCRINSSLNFNIIIIQYVSVNVLGTTFFQFCTRVLFEPGRNLSSFLLPQPVDVEENTDSVFSKDDGNISL